MAAIPQQGTYLGTTLAGFAGLVAGLVVRDAHYVLGLSAALVGLGALVYSGIGFYRIRNLGFTK